MDRDGQMNFHVDRFAKAQGKTNIKYIPVLTFLLAVSSSSLSDGLLRLNPGGGGPLNPGGGGCLNSSFPSSPSRCVEWLPLYPGGAVDFEPGGGGILNLSFADGSPAYNIRILSKQSSGTCTISETCLVTVYYCTWAYILLYMYISYINMRYNMCTILWQSYIFSITTLRICSVYGNGPWDPS